MVLVVVVVGACVVVVVVGGGGVIENPQPLAVQVCAPDGMQTGKSLGSNRLLMVSPTDADVAGATGSKVIRATLTTPVGAPRLAFWKKAIFVWQLFAVGHVVETVGVFLNCDVFPPEIKMTQEPPPGQSVSLVHMPPALVPESQAMGTVTTVGS